MKFSVDVKCIKSQRMVKILRFLYHCGIYLCVPTSSIASDLLWIERNAGCLYTQTDAATV